ncbi:zinc finger BED domain-containing protein RICESLEEPER 2-like protein [Tanacetum coccineum]
MCNKLSEFELNGGIYSSMVVQMKKKLRKYFEKIPPVITCAAALNPCFNVSGVEVLIESISTDLKFFDDEFATKAKDRFKTSLEGLYNIYYLKYSQQNQSSNAAPSSNAASSRNLMTNLLNKLKQNKKAKHDRITTSEYERYVESDFVSHLSTKELAGYDVLGFWKANESTFPVISQMARDILSVHAISVASESAFTTSGRVLSIRRTRLTPASLEMSEILEEEVQEHEAMSLSDEEVALDEAASEARSSGGEEIYDMTLSESD